MTKSSDAEIKDVRTNDESTKKYWENLANMEKLINMIKITERNSELPATNLETPGTYLLVLHPRNKGMNNAVTRRKPTPTIIDTIAERSTIILPIPLFSLEKERLNRILVSFSIFDTVGNSIGNFRRMQRKIL